MPGIKKLRELQFPLSKQFGYTAFHKLLQTNHINLLWREMEVRNTWAGTLAFPPPFCSNSSSSFLGEEELLLPLTEARMVGSLAFFLHLYPTEISPTVPTLLQVITVVQVQSHHTFPPLLNLTKEVQPLLWLLSLVPWLFRKWLHTLHCHHHVASPCLC